MEIERLESKMLVATQAIETTTAEIIRLRESELFPQLLDLVTGLVSLPLSFRMFSIAMRFAELERAMVVC